MSGKEIRAEPGKSYVIMARDVLASPMRSSHSSRACAGCVFIREDKTCGIQDDPVTCVPNEVIFVTNNAYQRRRVAILTVAKKLSS